jgi:hypothetical protein
VRCFKRCAVRIRRHECVVRHCDGNEDVEKEAIDSNVIATNRVTETRSNKITFLLATPSVRPHDCKWADLRS